MSSAADRNRLFGILGLQMGFVGRAQLFAAMRELEEKNSTPLGQILLQKQVLGVEERSLLELLVDKLLAKHGNDPERCLTAIISTDSARDALRQISDPEIDATRVLPPRDPGRHDRASAQTKYVGNSCPSGLRFQVLRPHAKGGLGEVFVARDLELGREVALKQILPNHADDPSIRSRFLTEAEITGGLEHPGVVPVYSLGCDLEGRPFYAMRFIYGDSLEHAIEYFHRPATMILNRAERRLQLRSLLGRFIDVCNAIEYAHSRGILHRDLKPSNIMLGNYGETLVVDWGLAKPVNRPDSAGSDAGVNTLKPMSGSASGPTQIDSAIGTPQYMSPEQAAGRPDQLGPASDVYSLGATLFCLLTGRPAFKETDLETLLRNVERGEFPSPREVRKDVPPPLEAICLKAMAQDRADRYPNPRILADDLEHWLADEPVTAYREPASERLARWTRRNRAWARSIAAAILLIAVMAVVAAFLIARSWREADRGFREARQAVNDYFTQVSENKLLDVPGLQPLRKELLESALAYYQKFLEQRSSDPALQSDVALTWYRVGRIQTQIERHAIAEQDFEQALSIQEEIVKSSVDPAATAALANTYNALGDLAQQTTKLEDARRWFQRARDLRKQLVDATPDDLQLRRKLANSDNNLATVDGRLGNLAEAKREFALADGVRQKLVADTSHQSDADQYRRDLAIGRYNFGAIMKEVREFSAALDSLHRAVKDFHALTKNAPNGIELRRELALAERLAGDTEMGLGNPTAALANYEHAKALAEPLARHNPLLAHLQADVADIWMGFGQLKWQSNDQVEALNQFQRARGILEQLAVDDPTVIIYRRDLSKCLDKIVAIQQRTGRLADARDTLGAARGVQQKLVTELPNDLDLQIAFGHTLDQLAVLLWRDDQKAEAISLSQEATAHLRLAFDKSPHDKSSNFAIYREALSNNYTNLGIFNRRSGKLAQAAALALERRKLWPDNARELYKVAGELALIAAVSGDSSAQPAAGATADRRVLVQQTIDVLHQAIDAGYDKFDDLQNDPRFKILASEEAFQRLLEKRGWVRGRKVATGETSDWSPDSTRLVITKKIAVQSDMGLEIRELVGGGSHALVQRGKDPAWSPAADGPIAFVRGSDPVKEEIWLVRPDNKEERKISSGGYPHWSGDGKTLYFHVRDTMSVMAISPSDPQATERLVCKLTESYYPVVSPDGSMVAYVAESRGLVVVKSADRELVKTWSLGATVGGGLAAWHPAGKRLAYSAYAGDESGLWLADLETGKSRKIVGGNAWKPVWSRDGKQLLYLLGDDIYIVDTDRLPKP